MKSYSWFRLACCGALGVAYAVSRAYAGPVVPAPQKPTGHEAKASTGAAAALTVDDLYQGNKQRDPFRALVGATASHATPSMPVYPQEISIHELNLKGILKDKTGAYAILVEPKSGASYLLRNGLLYGFRNKRVPGVTGVIQARLKSVILMTPDKDVQTLRLGEEDIASRER